MGVLGWLGRKTFKRKINSHAEWTGSFRLSMSVFFGEKTVDEEVLHYLPWAQQLIRGILKHHNNNNKIAIPTQDWIQSSRLFN